ncbi:hypothetical protein PABG_11089 [Paracoccidioides brasiliensis Pb03]|nr:hypothetical protein PABG_11089 [Paracoccidioides brasiliensis Pb03]
MPVLGLYERPRFEVLVPAQSPNVADNVVNERPIGGRLQMRISAAIYDKIGLGVTA